MRTRGIPHDPAESKTCRQCGVTKTYADFSLSRRATAEQNEVYRSNCKKCGSERALQWYRDNIERSAVTRRRRSLRTYGLTVEQYDALLARQGGGCGICDATDAGNDHKQIPVDHDHDTGRVRGLLCHRCNRAMGLLGDDIVLLKRAIAYLERE